MSVVDEFKHNDEFFIDEIDGKRLEKRFPNVYFAFYCEEASVFFDRIDQDARMAKAGFQRFGLGSVLLAVLALVVAAADPFLLMATETGALPDAVPKAVAAIAAAAGLLSITIGALGFGMGPRKREWQKKRLIGERLRQWQAQYVCSHIPEIIKAAGSNDRITAFISKRAMNFSIFKADYIDNVGCRLQEIEDKGHVATYNDRDADLGFNLWTNIELDHGSKRSLGSIEGNDRLILTELFEAYDATRFRSQEEFTKYMLGKGPIRTHPRAQEDWLKKIGISAIVAIVTLHIIVIWGVLADISALKSPAIHFLAVLTALIALGTRVLEDGLQPTSHVARLQDYLKAVFEAR